jgi:hypothetical protein
MHEHDGKSLPAFKVVQLDAVDYYLAETGRTLFMLLLPT